MNAELLYTSAPQGLKQGSRGFCTVQSTAGMPINLAMKLESLSGYRHLYPPGDSRAALNPVAWSHLRFSLGGRTVSVLSRIADYGLDYSQRTNKLAHHLVLDAPLPPAGPVTLIQQPGVLKTSWDGKCTTLPPPMIPGVSAPGPGICRTWQRLTGDAGWAGMVAQHWMQPRAKPLHLIFAESQSSQLMQLLAESMALLPPSMFWEATFSTYVTSLPPDIDCKVRCLVAGSEEARAIAARHTVIDLTKPNPAAPSGPAVEAARAGRSIQTAAAPVIAKAPERMLEQKLEDDFFVLPDQDDAELTLQPDRPPPVVAPKLPPSRAASLPPSAFQEPHKEHRRAPIEERARIATIVAACSVLLVLALGGLAAWRYQQALQLTQADIATGQQVNDWGLPKPQVPEPSHDTQKGGDSPENEQVSSDSSSDENDGQPNIQTPAGIQLEKPPQADALNEPQAKPKELPHFSLVTIEKFAFSGGPTLDTLIPGSVIRFAIPETYEISSVALRYVGKDEEEIKLVRSELSTIPSKWELEIARILPLEGGAGQPEFYTLLPSQMIEIHLQFKDCKGSLPVPVAESVGVFTARIDPANAMSIHQASKLAITQKIDVRFELPENLMKTNSTCEVLCNKQPLMAMEMGASKPREMKLSSFAANFDLPFVNQIFEMRDELKEIRKKLEELEVHKKSYLEQVLQLLSQVQSPSTYFIVNNLESPSLIENLKNELNNLAEIKRKIGELKDGSPEASIENGKKVDVEEKISQIRGALPSGFPVENKFNEFYANWCYRKYPKLQTPKEIYGNYIDKWRMLKKAVSESKISNAGWFQIRRKSANTKPEDIAFHVQFVIGDDAVPAGVNNNMPRLAPTLPVE
jgi:hypothetical protein